MLVFTVRLGDDVYIDGQQVIIHREGGDCLTVLTKDEEIDVPFGDEGIDFNNSVRLLTRYGDDAGSYQLGFDAPRDVLILSGRNYRRRLEA